MKVKHAWFSDVFKFLGYWHNGQITAKIYFHLIIDFIYIA